MREKEKVTDYFLMTDYRDEMPEFMSPSSCFIIWHHKISDVSIIEADIRKIIQAGCTHFSLFGEYFEKVIDIINRLDLNNACLAYGSTTDLDGIARGIIHYHKKDEKPYCYLIYDDYYFAQYVKEDFIHHGRDVKEEIRIRMAANYGVVEFVYKGRDCIFNVSEDDFMIGYLGYEKHFPIPEFALYEHLFDGKTFLQIWDDVKDQFV
jgi:hypothetical protein